MANERRRPETNCGGTESTVRRWPKSEVAQGFPAVLLSRLQHDKGLRIRAGSGDHRFIGIWVVVVKDRVFVRS